MTSGSVEDNLPATPCDDMPSLAPLASDYWCSDRSPFCAGGHAPGMFAFDLLAASCCSSRFRSAISRPATSVTTWKPNDGF